jgi:hypothetical protein
VVLAEVKRSRGGQKLGGGRRLFGLRQEGTVVKLEAGRRVGMREQESSEGVDLQKMRRSRSMWAGFSLILAHMPVRCIGSESHLI